MRVTWLSHKGKKVLFSNYVGCKNAEETIEVLHKGVPPPERLFTLIRNKSHN